MLKMILIVLLIHPPGGSCPKDEFMEKLVKAEWKVQNVLDYDDPRFNGVFSFKREPRGHRYSSQLIAIGGFTRKVHDDNDQPGTWTIEEVTSGTFSLTLTYSQPEEAPQRYLIRCPMKNEKEITLQPDEGYASNDRPVDEQVRCRLMAIENR